MFLRLLASPLPQIIFYYTIITFYYTISHSSRNDEVKKLVATWLFHSSHKNWRLAMKTSSQSLKCRHDNHHKLHHRVKCKATATKLPDVSSGFHFPALLQICWHTRGTIPASRVDTALQWDSPKATPASRGKGKILISFTWDLQSLNWKISLQHFCKCLLSVLSFQKIYDSGFTPLNTLYLILHVLSNLKAKNSFHRSTKKYALVKV